MKEMSETDITRELASLGIDMMSDGTSVREIGLRYGIGYSACAVRANDLGPPVDEPSIATIDGFLPVLPRRLKSGEPSPYFSG